MDLKHFRKWFSAISLDLSNFQSFDKDVWLWESTAMNTPWRLPVVADPDATSRWRIGHSLKNFKFKRKLFCCWRSVSLKRKAFESEPTNRRLFSILFAHYLVNAVTRTSCSHRESGIDRHWVKVRPSNFVEIEHSSLRNGSYWFLIMQKFGW